MRSVGLLGAGAIGMSIIQAFEKGLVSGYRLDAVLARPHQMAAVREKLGADALVTSDPDTFLGAEVCLVIEAAGHQAAQDFGPFILERGRDFYLLSVGIMADETVQAAFRKASARGGSKIVIPSGALAGFDGLRALAQIELCEVIYTSTKPPYAWKDTPGEAIVRAGGHDEVIMIFEGNAADAALKFPKNANLAAAIAIAGIGFERTTVRLVSDPSSDENIGSIVARAASSALHLTMSGSSFEDNPKSSQVTGASIVAALINTDTALSYG